MSAANIGRVGFDKNIPLGCGGLIRLFSTFLVLFKYEFYWKLISNPQKLIVNIKKYLPERNIPFFDKSSVIPNFSNSF